ncbi:MAG: hypothetical protein AAGI51_03000 [Pseudomonadota bacterium]
MRGVLLIAGAWLAAGAALAWAMMAGWLPDAAGDAGFALALSMAATGPAALAGFALVLEGAARRDRAALAERAARLEAELRAVAGGGTAAEGLDREELARALSTAAREALDAEREAIARRMAELAETQRRLDAALTALLDAAEAASTPPATTPAAADPLPEASAPPRASVPGAPPRPVEDDLRQPGLPLDEEVSGAVGGAALDWGVLAAALDFPRHAGDAEGFAALDAARRDRGAAELLRAAEDALTLLSQKGLYMEDLAVRHAPAETWRRFAEGERGPAVRAAGGVEAAEAVATVRELMKSDPVFRDTALHLMRRYDALLRRAVRAPEGEGRLLSLADSRTGRAFMAVAQASGVFD